MQDTRITEETDSIESQETNFESFREAQEAFESEVQHGKTGHARLTDCELVDVSEIPEEYKNTFRRLGKNYLVFDAVLGNSEKNVKVVCPARDNGVNIETVREWTGTSEIDELAGQRIPVQHIDGDVYRVELFRTNAGGDANLDAVPIPAIKWLIEKEQLNFEGGQWKAKSFVTLGIVTATIVPYIMIMLASGMLPGVMGGIALLCGTLAYSAFILSVKRN